MSFSFLHTQFLAQLIHLSPDCIELFLRFFSNLLNISSLLSNSIIQLFAFHVDQAFVPCQMLRFTLEPFTFARKLLGGGKKSCHFICRIIDFLLFGLEFLQLLLDVLETVGYTIHDTRSLLIQLSQCLSNVVKDSTAFCFFTIVAIQDDLKTICQIKIFTFCRVHLLRLCLKNLLNSKAFLGECHKAFFQQHVALLTKSRNLGHCPSHVTCKLLQENVHQLLRRWWRRKRSLGAPRWNRRSNTGMLRCRPGPARSRIHSSRSVPDSFCRILLFYWMLMFFLICHL